MADDTLIKVDGVSKKYCRNLKRSLWYGVQDMCRELQGRTRVNGILRAEEFWALKDVSFEVKRGEILGVIGPNGAGKSTLLKILNGLIRPDEGSVTLRGRVQGLTELGSGFNPILTGRENIFVNAAVLGIPKETVKLRFDEIVEFSDIGQFIDTPVQFYSSGMKVRLGFSVVVHMNPDVLLVDEVLSVGDMAFGRKARKRMNEMMDSGITIVFVSHSIRQVEMLCQNTLFLNKGVIQACGLTPEVSERYYAFANSASRIFEKDDMSLTAVNGKYADSSLFEVTRVELLNEAAELQEHFRMLELLVIRVHFVAHRRVEGLKALFKFQTIDGIYVSSFSSLGQDAEPDWIGPGYVDCVIRELPLREGVYVVAVALSDANGGLFKSDRAAELSVVPDRTGYANAISRFGLVHIDTSWRFGPTEGTGTEAVGPNATNKDVS